MRQIETAREAARITSFLQAGVGNDVGKDQRTDDASLGLDLLYWS